MSLHKHKHMLNSKTKMSVKGRVGVGGGEMGSRNAVVSRNLALLLCFGSFSAGILFTNRIWTEPERTNLESENCNQKLVSAYQAFI